MKNRYLVAIALAAIAASACSKNADKPEQVFATVNGENITTKEFKASHILVKTEDEANALIAKLNKGADFADLAKKNSIDPGSGKNGGDLGWFPGKQMVPEFTAAVEQLEKGKVTEKPVKSQF